ncbi:MAG: hypothetical protein LBM78_02890 [Clostridiales bacterium]|nr:hypothetical protein [Clostridiales bacterium]
MKKLKVVVLASEKRKLLESLSRTGVFEPVAPEKKDGTVMTFDKAEDGRLSSREARVQFGIDFINECKIRFQTALLAHAKLVERGGAESVPYTFEKEKKPLFAVRDEVGYENFRLVSTREDEIADKLTELERQSNRLFELKAAEGRLKVILADLQPYLPLDMPFSSMSAGTKTAFVLCGTVPRSKAGLLHDFLANAPYCADITEGERLVTLAVAGRLEDKKPLADALAGLDFSVCPFTFPVTAAARYEELSAEYDAIKYERLTILNDVRQQTNTLRLLKLYFDYLEGAREALRAEERQLQTKRTVIMEGWYPSTKENDILLSVQNASNSAVLETREALDDEVPPTLAVNGGLVAPFEGITNMFSVPGYHEKDPNPFMSVFFFLFFGLMLGDAGYGIVLLLGCLALLRFCKMEPGMRNMIKLFCICSVATIFWGALLGGWFSLTKADGSSIIPAVFPQLNPMDYPINFMILALILGAVHIVVGLILKAAIHFRAGEVWDALLNPITDILIFVGVAGFLLGNMVLHIQILTYIGAAIAIFAVLVILFFRGRHNPGIIKKVTGGIGGFYGLVNYFSDVLSYSRIFGLGISTAVIGMVANMMAGMMFGIAPVIGHIAGIIVALILHAFNLAMNLLGCYVHDARLQLVEFYGKFYDGGGHIFQPLGGNTKYYVVK